MENHPKPKVNDVLCPKCRRLGWHAWEIAISFPAGRLFLFRMARSKVAVVSTWDISSSRPRVITKENHVWPVIRVFFGVSFNMFHQSEWYGNHNQWHLEGIPRDDSMGFPYYSSNIVDHCRTYTYMDWPLENKVTTSLYTQGSRKTAFSNHAHIFQPPTAKSVSLRMGHQPLWETAPTKFYQSRSSSLNQQPCFFLNVSCGGMVTFPRTLWKTWRVDCMWFVNPWHPVNRMSMCLSHPLSLCHMLGTIWLTPDSCNKKTL